MLELMRRKAQSPYIQATIVIIILVFVFWGVGTNDGPGRNDAATVNDQTITYREFQQAYERTTNQYRQQFGGSLPQGLLEALNLRQQVLNQLIDRALLLQGAEAMGLRVSDEEIRNTIQSMGSFQNNGVFDVNRYKELLASSRLTPANFEASIRTDLLTDKVASALNRFAQVTPEELRNRFVYDYETTTIAYVTFTGKEFTDKVQVDEEGLATFFAGHQENYKTAPQRKLNYLFFSKKEAGSQPAEAEVEAYYQQHRDQYAMPEQRHARHILLRSTPEADQDAREKLKTKLSEILEQARKGGDFAALAKQHSQDSSAAKGGDLGFFGRGRMVPPFEEAVFAMKEGEVSEIVETRFGFHIIKLEKINPPRQQELAEVKEQIIAKLAAEQGSANAFKAAGNAYEQIILAGSLQKYAEANQVAVRHTDFFARSNAPKELADKPSLLNSAFSLNQGELSSLIEDHNGYSILFVEESKAPEVPALEAVRARVERDFVAAEAKKLAENAAQAMLTALQDGTSMGDQAQKIGRTVKVENYSRAERSKATLPGPVLDKGLELSTNAPLPGKVITNNDTFYVVQLRSRKEPAAEAMAEKEAELRDKLLQENQGALLAAWLDNQRSTAEISVNQQVLGQ